MTEALLLTMMDPPRGADAEFNDWANLEHLPERKRVAGFRTARRYRNKASSPRYLALYDLEDLGVLKTPAYLAISGDNLSPWSKRLLAGATARWRFEGLRIGAVANDAKGLIAELLLVTWRDLPGECNEIVASTLETAVGNAPGVVRVRGFVGERSGSFDYVGIAECSQPFSAAFTDRARYTATGRSCDAVHVFVPLQGNET